VDQIFNLLIAAVVFGFVYWAIQPRYVFVISIDDGVARAAKGKVAAAFVGEVSDACGQAGVRRGWVGGVASGKRVKLAFSWSIPIGCRQQLRNLWAMQR
jgi:hypothetical protein